MRDFYEDKTPIRYLLGAFILISIISCLYILYIPTHVLNWILLILSLFQVKKYHKKRQGDKPLLIITPTFIKIKAKKVNWTDIQSAKLHKPLPTGRAIKLIIKTKKARYYLPLENFSRNNRYEIFSEFERRISITFVNCIKASLNESLCFRISYTLLPWIYCLIFLLLLQHFSH